MIPLVAMGWIHLVFFVLILMNIHEICLKLKSGFRIIHKFSTLDIKRVHERQGGAHIKVEIKSNLEFQRLTLSPTQGPGPPQIQIHVHDAYEIGFGLSTYARKEDEIKFPMALVLGPTKIGFDQNC
jgi:hypothetical protein